MNADDRHFLIARSLFREANDAFFLFEPGNLRVVDLNPAALRLTGLERQAACAMTLGDLFSSSETQGLEHLVMAVKETGFFHSREGYSLRRATGPPLAVNVSVSRIHTEPDSIGLVVARDISERKRAEAALRQAQARYHSLLESTGVVVWEISREGLILQLSPAFETITGWSRGEWIGRPFTELVHPEDNDDAVRWHESAIRGESLPHFELRIRARSGIDLNCEFLLVTRVRGESDDRIMGICRDITEKRRFERMLEQVESMRRAKEEAEKANQSKSDFLSNVSHEIRTPLAALLGFSELVSDHPYLHESPAEIHEYLAVVRDQGQILLALTDDLLDLARIEAGQMRIKREACVLPQIISNAVESVRRKADARQLKLEVEIARDVPRTIVSDRLRIQQILMNLLDNAIKFTERGKVRLDARLIEVKDADSRLEIEVHDTGIGMSAEEVSGLFQPYYRVRSGRRHSPRGTGLGLAICQRLARQLGGEVVVHSKPGSGSAFVLILPLEIPAADKEGPSPGRVAADMVQSPGELPPVTPLLGARILLAEDHDANRELICFQLRRAGAEVVPARNGKEALELVREASRAGHPIDAVIIDMEMPILDGYEAVRQLRARNYAGPIIAVTAHAMDTDRDECLGLGCDDHITKPIEWTRLFQRLGELLARRGTGRMYEAKGPEVER